MDPTQLWTNVLMYFDIDRAKLNIVVEERYARIASFTQTRQKDKCRIKRIRTVESTKNGRTLYNFYDVYVQLLTSEAPSQNVRRDSFWKLSGENGDSSEIEYIQSQRSTRADMYVTFSGLVDFCSKYDPVTIMALESKTQDINGATANTIKARSTLVKACFPAVKPGMLAAPYDLQEQLWQQYLALEQVYTVLDDENELKQREVIRQHVTEITEQFKLVRSELQRALRINEHAKASAHGISVPLSHFCEEGVKLQRTQHNESLHDNKFPMLVWFTNIDNMGCVDADALVCAIFGHGPQSTELMEQLPEACGLTEADFVPVQVPVDTDDRSDDQDCLDRQSSDTVRRWAVRRHHLRKVVDALLRERDRAQGGVGGEDTARVPPACHGREQARLLKRNMDQCLEDACKRFKSAIVAQASALCDDVMAEWRHQAAQLEGL